MTTPANAVSAAGTSLAVTRVIRRDAASLFAMWTQPSHLVRWWGPRDVACIAAEVDLRVGGRYRIGNRLPDGRVLWIGGAFEVVEAPQLLIYTWRIELDSPADEGSSAATAERVTVRFETTGVGTLVSVLHEQIADDATRASHAHGWEGCLDGLARYAEAAAGVANS